MSAVTVSIPHDLSPADVRGRLEKGLADARAKFGPQLSGFREQWTETGGTFSFTTMGQTVTGSVAIEPKTVNVSVDLPWFLKAMAGRLRPRIEEEGRKLLAKNAG